MAPRTMMLSTIANAAPWVTPSSPGSARGLRVWPCMSAPATPSATPARMPSAVLGSRSERTMMSFSVPVGPVSPCQTSASGTDLAPIAMLSTTAAARAADSPARTSRRRPRRAWSVRARPVDGGRAAATAVLTCTPFVHRSFAGTAPSMPV